LEKQGISGGSYRNAFPSYAIPNIGIFANACQGPLRSSALRSLGGYANVFALESFMDELAYQAKQDPVDFRLAHLKDERSIAVIRRVAELVDWKKRRADGQRGLGVAFAQYKNHAAYIAVVAEVESHEDRGSFQLKKLSAVIDAGQVINPDGLKNQTEGGLIQSASWTLYEQVRFDKEGLRSKDWQSYPILRFPQLPEIEVEIISRPELDPLGAGEAAQGPTSAAIANAVFAATGSRIRSLPLSGAGAALEEF
jgi:nicotinate dehydrogenase subunit B